MTRTATVWIGIVTLVFGGNAGGAAEPAGSVLQVLQIDEHFGVAHPRQVIDFDLQQPVDPAKVHVVDAAGQPVLFQVLDGGKKVAIQTDLPAHQSRRWQLIQGAAPKQLPSEVTVAEHQEKGRSVYQITNGLTGVRVPMPVKMPAALWKPPNDLFNYGPSSPRLFLPAPVQGVLYRDGKWSATGPNGLVCLANKLINMEVRFLEKGPLKVVAQVGYTVEHPEYRYGAEQLKPAGRASYRCTITLLAGQPSVLFEEDTDLEMTWSMDLYDGLQPTTARYRGHSAKKKEYGAEPDGQVLRPGHARRPVDATVELRYDKPMRPSYTRTDTSWAPLSVWDRWAGNTGWYWQLLDAQAPAQANLVGFFAGRAGQAVGAANSGVCLFTQPAAADQPGARPKAGLSVSSYRRSASGQLFLQSRFQWGLFVGTKGHDLKPPAEVQPINQQMNLHGGFNLNKIHRYTLDFPDPPGGYGGLYMDRKAVAALLQKLRADKGGPNGKGFHGYLYNVDPPSRPLIDMWADPGGAKLQTAVAAVNQTAHEMLTAFVHGLGIYDPHYSYWHGGLAMMRHGVWIDQILADPRTTEEQRRQLKAAAVLFGNVLWDNDFVPMDNPHGLNLGTANMPVQQSGYRDFYALLLARHPTMIERAKLVDTRVRATVRRLINESGAEIGCPHYMGASFAPTLNTLMQLKQLGKDDPFRTESRLANFAAFYLNLLTPPEPRVGGKRALISLGDGSTEPSELFGVLGTGFRDADPALSARLMAAWHACGKPHSSFFGTTLLMIDDSLPATDPKLGDVSIPGYCSVLRHGWGTPNETAVWFVNGDHYSDHRHNDHGSLVIYALGKPLAIDWGSLYTPQAPGAYMHSGVVLEKEIGHAWDKDGPSLKAGGAWRESTLETFASFAEGAYARARFKAGQTVWTRAVLSIHADERQPILVIRDTFSGEGAQAAKVLTLNLMAEGDVETPAGKVAPALRRHPVKDHKGEEQDQLPSASRPFAVPAGAQRLGFKGKYDVDWDVYVVGDESQQALIGNWAVTPLGGFITDQEERQHILRVRGNGTFTTVILPWRRGEKPEGLSVSREGDAVVVKSATGTARIEPTGYTYAHKERSVTRRWDK